MRARILVTRPQHDAQPWVSALQSRGWEAHALPLMGIGPCSDEAAQQALAQARAWTLTPAHYRAVMFVSGNAVQYFFASNSPEALTHQALLAPDTRAWTPGPGTARALLAAGIPAGQIDGPAADAAQFESETLWQRVGKQIRPGDRLTLTREPHNRHDRNAVRVDWNGQPLGYLPRRENRAVAQALDAGQTLDARVARLRDVPDPWQRVLIDVYLRL